MNQIEFDLYNQTGLRPTSYDREGALYSKENAALALIPQINNNCFFNKDDKKMNKEIEKATKSVESHIKILVKAICDNDNKIKDLDLSVKKSSQKSRIACNEIKQAISMLDKEVNIDKLSRIADTLERVATAMNTLSLIEQNGKLERILSAMK